jgi:translation initiation factor IF-2
LTFYKGFVLESKVEKGRGALATVLVTAGTISINDWVVVGTISGKIKYLLDHKGREIEEATPGTPVEVIGLKEVHAFFFIPIE